MVYLMWNYLKEKGEAQVGTPWCCSFGGMNQSVSRKWCMGPQGPEETQAGERHNSEPASVTSARRGFRVEVTIHRECFKQSGEQSPPHVTPQSVGREGEKAEEAGEGQVACGGNCHPQKGWCWQVSRLIRTPSL